MITTLSKQAGRRYPQMGSTGQPWAGWMPSVGETTIPPVVEIIDTHDGARKRDARYRKQQDERKQDVIRAFNRVFGIEMPKETPVPEVVAAVEAKVFKPKKNREKELLRMALGLRAMMHDGERIAADIRREQEEEDFIVSLITCRSLH